jgi:protein-S-isoprenylcysteine O-methyltransferase Ste14
MKMRHFLFSPIFLIFVSIKHKNTMLFLLFSWLLYGFIHSLMASYFFKDFMSKILGKYVHFYRLIYNFIAFALLIPVLALQFSLEKIPLWQVSDYQSVIGKFISVLGVIFVAIALQGYDLSEFLGTDFGKKNKESAFKTDGLLEYVRHPIYTGTLLLIWGFFIADASTRSLTGAVALTIYVLIGIYFEEKKLIMVFGEQYRNYQKQVPMLIPFLKF